MIDIYSTDDISPSTIPTGEKAGFVENLANAWSKSFYNETPQGRFQEDNQLISKQKDLLLSTGAVSPMEGLLFDQYQGTPFSDWYKAHTPRIQELQKQNPNAGYKTYEEIHQETLQNHAKINQEADKAYVESSGLGKVGYLLGNILGFSSDPMNDALMVSTPSGLVRGAGFLTNALKSTAVNTVVLGAANALNKPGEVQLRRELGQPVSTAGAVGEVISESLIGGATAGIGGAALEKLIGKIPIGKYVEDVSKGTTGATGKPIDDIVNELDNAPKTQPINSQEVADAVQLKAEANDLLAQKPTSIPTSEFLDTYQKTYSGMVTSDENLLVADSILNNELNIGYPHEQWSKNKALAGEYPYTAPTTEEKAKFFEDYKNKLKETSNGSIPTDTNSPKSGQVSKDISSNPISKDITTNTLTKDYFNIPNFISLDENLKIDNSADMQAVVKQTLKDTTFHPTDVTMDDGRVISAKDGLRSTIQELKNIDILRSCILGRIK